MGAAAVVLALIAVVASPSDGSGHRTVLLGHSVDGRAITAVESGDFDSPRKAVIVGCMHGNECAGIAIASALAAARAPSEVDLWIVSDVNPDGHAADTRQNAHGVDLNRNFPWRWQPLTGLYDSGPRPFSEPESRLAARLIERVRPTVSIWFHQHLDVVDDSTGSVTIESRLAHAAGMRIVPLAKEPGSAVTWETRCLPTATAFVVELPSGSIRPAGAERYVDAVSAAVAASPERRPQVAEACET